MIVCLATVVKFSTIKFQKYKNIFKVNRVIAEMAEMFKGVGVVIAIGVMAEAIGAK